MAAAAIALGTIREGFTGPEEVSNLQGFVLELVIFASLGAAFLVTARGWWQCKRWARSLHVLGQLLILVVSVPSLQAIDPVQQGIAWLATAVAAVTLVLCLTPAVTRAIITDD